MRSKVDMPDHLGWKLTDLTCEELYEILQSCNARQPNPTLDIAIDKVKDAIYRKERRMPNVHTRTRELGIFEKRNQEHHGF